MRQIERGFQAAMLLSRWLIAPFLVGLVCCLALLIYRFFADLYETASKLPTLTWHDLVVEVLNLVDVTLTANLVLIVIFSSYENFIGRVTSTRFSTSTTRSCQVSVGSLLAVSYKSAKKR